MLQETFSVDSAATGPLEFSYPITTQASVKTMVYGEARNMAAVSLMSGTMTLWTGTMTQQAPYVSSPPNLLLGNITVVSADFTLTIPTEFQNGSVLMKSTILSGEAEYPFNAQVATWPLSSTAAV